MMYAADGQGYVDDAIDGIEVDNIYVSPEVPDADALEATLAQQVGDASIGIAVLSDNALLEASGPDIVREIATAHPDCETVIVAVGDDLWAGSHALGQGEAMGIANQAEQSTDSLEAALTETVQGVIAASDAAGAGDDGVGGGPIIGGVLTVAVVLAAGVAVWGVSRSRRRSRGENRHAPLPDTVRPLVARLRALSGEYAAAAASGNPVAGEVSAEVSLVAENATELFDRLDRKGDEGQRATAAVEYGETLRKLTAALDRDYLLDILEHPDLWDEPGDRVREVRTALSSFSSELVENIKQVNARRGLHFQVSLDGLIGRRKELQEWDRAFERADGETGPIPRAD
ncbi:MULTISPECIES: hypothetical protein [Microbacterium]|uniref:hypothetical protein n=1 Tax=Microbacterium TaxID=33882 RepID=UPI0013A54711|nr:MULTISPECIES: hypothetical protein [Microbacterium]